jgi:hypothetical protein
MDRNRRVVIPPLWHPVGDDALFVLLSKAHGLPMLQVLNRERYEERMERISEREMSPPEKRRLMSRLERIIYKATLNDQGKLKIPKDLCGKAGLARPAGDSRQACRRYIAARFLPVRSNVPHVALLPCRFPLLRRPPAGIENVSNWRRPDHERPASAAVIFTRYLAHPAFQGCQLATFSGLRRPLVAWVATVAANREAGNNSTASYEPSALFFSQIVRSVMR